MQFENNAVDGTDRNESDARHRVSSTKERIERLGAAVRRERQELGMSQQALADAVGTDQAVIARLEAGKHNTGIASYIRIADSLGISLSDLIDF